jgi:hypothetical protein
MCVVPGNAKHRENIYKKMEKIFTKKLGRGYMEVNPDKEGVDAIWVVNGRRYKIEIKGLGGLSTFDLRDNSKKGKGNLRKRDYESVVDFMLFIVLWTGDMWLMPSKGFNKQRSGQLRPKELYGWYIGSISRLTLFKIFKQVCASKFDEDAFRRYGKDEDKEMYKHFKIYKKQTNSDYVNVMFDDMGLNETQYEVLSIEDLRNLNDVCFQAISNTEMSLVQKDAYRVISIKLLEIAYDKGQGN